MGSLKVLVFGDSYRYQFLRSLLETNKYNNETLHTEFLKQHHCILSRAKELSEYKGKPDYLLFQSPYVPAYSQIIFPRDKVTDWPETGVQTKVIVFDEIPYATASELTMADSLAQKYHQVLWKIFLVRPEQNFAKTDLTTGKTAAEEAKSFIQKKKYPVEIYDHDAKKALFWDLPGEIDFWRIHNSLQQIAQTISVKMKNLSLSYQLFLLMNEQKYINPSIYQSFTQFSSRIPYENVYAVYAQECENYYLKGQGKNIFASLFQNVITEILEEDPLWEKEKAEGEAIHYLQDDFKKWLHKIAAQNEVFQGDSEEEYIKYCQKYHVDTQFFRELERFFKGANGDLTKSLLYQSVNRYIRSFIQQLGGFMKNGK